MKKTKKIVALVLAAVMLVCTTVAATVAYLTANTKVVNNTFTVGKVVIDLLETEVDEYGTDVTPNPTVKTNEYKLIPGHNYMKDPTVFVEEGSEKCWLFVKVENDIENIEADTKIAAQMTANGWFELEVEGNKVANVYYFNGIVDAREAAVRKVVFNEFTLATNADVASLADAQGNVASVITIDAYAVQADGFDSAAAAWAAAPTTWGE